MKIPLVFSIRPSLQFLICPLVLMYSTSAASDPLDLELARRSAALATCLGKDASICSSNANQTIISCSEFINAEFLFKSYSKNGCDKENGCGEEGTQYREKLRELLFPLLRCALGQEFSGPPVVELTAQLLRIEPKTAEYLAQEFVRDLQKTSAVEVAFAQGSADLSMFYAAAKTEIEQHSEKVPSPTVIGLFAEQFNIAPEPALKELLPMLILRWEKGTKSVRRKLADFAELSAELQTPLVEYLTTTKEVRDGLRLALLEALSNRTVNAARIYQPPKN